MCVDLYFITGAGLLYHSVGGKGFLLKYCGAAGEEHKACEAKSFAERVQMFFTRWAKPNQHSTAEELPDCSGKPGEALCKGLVPDL